LNFFDAQDRARRATRWLVVVYIIATLLIVAGVTLIVGFAFGIFSGNANNVYADSDPTGLLVTTAIATTLFIFAASLYKTSVLSAGGGRVATEMGGTLVPADVRDPLRRQLRNVVEEMAIASGVPVPEIYVMEEEAGINAFAAGYSPGDAAVAVTRGTLELLNRDELQGVIAHEFSHIMNGDMRLNIRMMGVLFGILALSLIGRMITRGGYHVSLASRRDRGAPVILIIGLGLAILGAIGMFFARMIKAAVSRQREFLADASAVQFTRQSAGIANALKKIGGYSEASYLQVADPEEVSHMLFGSGSRLFGLFATHPPLGERIRALDPSFDEQDYPRVDAMAEQPRSVSPAADALTAGITTALAGDNKMVLPESIAESVGRPAVEHVEYARQIRESIPENLYDAAHSTSRAYLLTLALILDRSGTHVERQFALVEERMGEERTRLVRGYYRELQESGEEFRLPLLEISFPALKLRPAAQLGFLIELASRLIEIDGRVDLYEYCFYRILTTNLGQSVDPTARRTKGRAPKRELRQAAVNILAIVADHGHDDAAQGQEAFAAGADVLGEWARGVEIEPRREYTVDILNHSLDILQKLNNKGRHKLLRAVSEVADHDQRLTVGEAELIRVICATLDCPLPPILVNKLPREQRD
jgi:Zn-dependent protease with chaperone function